MLKALRFYTLAAKRRRQHFWIRNWSHIATLTSYLVVFLVFLLVGVTFSKFEVVAPTRRTTSSKTPEAPSFLIGSRFGMKFGRIFLGVNTHRLTQSDFRLDDPLSKLRL